MDLNTRLNLSMIVPNVVDRVGFLGFFEGARALFVMLAGVEKRLLNNEKVLFYTVDKEISQNF